MRFQAFITAAQTPPHTHSHPLSSENDASSQNLTCRNLSASKNRACSSLPLLFLFAAASAPAGGIVLIPSEIRLKANLNRSWNTWVLRYTCGYATPPARKLLRLGRPAPPWTLLHKSRANAVFNIPLPRSICASEKALTPFLTTELTTWQTFSLVQLKKVKKKQLKKSNQSLIISVQAATLDSRSWIRQRW